MHHGPTTTDVKKLNHENIQTTLDEELKTGLDDEEMREYSFYIDFVYVTDRTKPECLTSTLRSEE